MNAGTGLVLSHRYTLTDQIAAGGMGEVWAAVDMVLDRPVAVKLLNPALSQEAGFVERFRAEATCSAALDHPNITKVYDYGVDQGSPYLVMELVAGQPLSEIISERGPLSAEETVPILIQAARALDAAHRGGVVHRDVKPANILITADGTAKLTDFGIARLVDSVHLTQVGQLLGTSLYLSPEQATGQGATVSSDIYALGVVGHEMLAGHPPFDGGSIVAGAVGIGMLAAFALPDGSGATGVPVTTATSQPTPAPDNATPSTHAVTVAGPPADTPSVPRQLDRAKGRSRGHDDKKDGKK